jgi:hypothetical protein
MPPLVVGETAPDPVALVDGDGVLEAFAADRAAGAHELRPALPGQALVLPFGVHRGVEVDAAVPAGAALSPHHVRGLHDASP